MLTLYRYCGSVMVIVWRTIKYSQCVIHVHLQGQWKCLTLGYFITFVIYKYTNIWIFAIVIDRSYSYNNFITTPQVSYFVVLFQLDQAELGMPSRDYYMKGYNDSDVKIYEKFAINIAMLFGANETTAQKEIKDMVDFEIRLANVRVFKG